MLYRSGRLHLQKDINLLEKIQRRVTKLIYSLRDKSYNERLKALKLTTLQMRQTRGDRSIQDFQRF
jgi:ribonuclease P/MRP protein subunit RPP40